MISLSRIKGQKREIGSTRVARLSSIRTPNRGMAVRLEPGVRVKVMTQPYILFKADVPEPAQQIPQPSIASIFSYFCH